MLGTPQPLPWRSSLSLSQRRVDTASVSRSTGRRRASVFPQRPKLHGNTVIKEGGEKFKGLAQPRGLDSDPPEKWGGGGASFVTSAPMERPLNPACGRHPQDAGRAFQERR